MLIELPHGDPINTVAVDFRDDGYSCNPGVALVDARGDGDLKHYSDRVGATLTLSAPGPGTLWLAVIFNTAAACDGCYDWCSPPCAVVIDDIQVTR